MSEDVAAQIREQFDLASSGWEKWDEISQQRDPRRYLDAANVKAGHRVLEIGAGTGLQTVAIAGRVGPEGSVVAIDLSPGMLAVARKRLAAAGFDNVEIHSGAFGEVGLGTDGFDAAVSGFTWLFLPDPVGDAARVRRHLEPGGRFAASVWGSPADATLFALPRDVVERELEITLPEVRRSEIGPLYEDGVFARVLTDAGFDDVEVAPFDVDMTFRSAVDYTDWVRDAVVSVGRVIKEHAPDREAEVFGAIEAEAASRARPDGTVTISSLALLGVGVA